MNKNTVVRIVFISVWLARVNCDVRVWTTRQTRAMFHGTWKQFSLQLPRGSRLTKGWVDVAISEKRGCFDFLFLIPRGPRFSSHIQWYRQTGRATWNNPLATIVTRVIRRWYIRVVGVRARMQLSLDRTMQVKQFERTSRFGSLRILEATETWRQIKGQGW